MINVQDKRKCSGCKACANICPVNAISFYYDSDGFFYPRVDGSVCINCSRCEKACPFYDKDHGVPEVNKSSVPEFYAAQLKEKSELKLVSSGGAFQAFAQTVIKNGGVVYGAVQENVDHIYHIRASNNDELSKTRRSKYFQSDIGECFQKASKDLRNNRIVLFSGTGCQIAGLNRYLGKEYDNLYTCEVVCHGVPSAKVWASYRTEKEKITGKVIKDLVFRDKSNGWSKNQYKITYEDGSTEFERSTIHPFHAGYLQGLFYRPSCGTCVFASVPRTADITLADYWQYVGPMNTEDIGVSLVVINNAKGKKLLELSGALLEVETTNRESALSSCRHMDEHPVENPMRRAFLDKVSADGYFAAAKMYLSTSKKSVFQRIKAKVLKLIGRI